jgi:hypothetical protein
MDDNTSHNKELLNLFYSAYLEEINEKLPSNITPNKKEKNIKLVFVNGRYHGLIPSFGPEEYYGGHPGIFYQSIINALGTGAKTFLIIMSAKEEGHGSEYPIEAILKQGFIEEWIEILKGKLPDNIIQKLVLIGKINHEDIDSFKDFLQREINGIKIEISPMGSGNPLLHQIFNTELSELSATSAQTLMVTGLEKNKNTGEWINKYSKTFPQSKFILLGREGGISGTEIRNAVTRDDYIKIAKWIINTGMSQDERVPILVGRIIHAINQSNETNEYEEGMRIFEHIGLTEAEERISKGIYQAATDSTNENKRKIDEIYDEYDDLGMRKINDAYPGKAPGGGTKRKITKRKITKRKITKRKITKRKRKTIKRKITKN